MKKIVFIFFVHFVISIGLFAQSPDYKFRRVSPSGGVTFKAVHQITQDGYGYMWFATTDQGIIRYDSKELQQFRHNTEDSTSLISNDVSRLLIDNNNKLWVATQDGLDVFIRSKNIFKHFKYRTEDGQPTENFIHYISKDQNGNIWIVDETGVGKLDTIKHILHRLKIDSSLESPGIVYFDAFQRGWVGTFNGSIYSIDLKSHSLSKFIDSPGSRVNTIYADKNELYIGYLEHGAKKYNLKGDLIKQYQYGQDSKYSLQNEKIRSIIKGTDGRLWIGAYRGLFVESEGNLFKISSDIYPEIPHNSTYSIYEDHNNNLWFGTWSGGIFYMNPSDNNFIHYKHDNTLTSISNNMVSSFAEMTDGRIAVGTESGGLNMFNPDDGKFEKISINKYGENNFNIKSLCIDNKGGLWVGTFNKQLWYKPSDQDYYTHFPQGLEDGKHISSRSVYSLCPCDSGVWIGGSRNSVDFYDFKTKKISHLKSKYFNSISPDNYIRSLYVDSYNNLWIGNQDGILKINRRTGNQVYFSTLEPANRRLSSSTIYYIYEVGENIWLGTKSGGINIIHNQSDSVSWFDANGLLTGRDVYGFVEDQEKRIWITSNEGIVLYNPNINTYRRFTVQDGIQGNIFNPKAIFKDSKNRMYFGGTNGLTLVNPKKIKLNSRIPNIILNNIIINNKEEISLLSDNGVNIAKNLKLRPFENSIRFEFTADNYLLPGKNQFKYRLLNIYDEWIDAGNDGIATFTNLPSGEYIFEIKACNNDGIWNNLPTRIFIHIATPWYRTIIAYIIYYLIFMVIVFLVTHEIRNRQQLKKSVIIEKIQREHEEQLHEMKLKFFTNISHEFRTPLTLISGPVKKLLGSVNIDNDEKSMLNIIERNSARLLNLINQIMDLRKIEKGQDKLFISSIDLIGFTRQLFSNFTEEASRRNINFIFHHDKKQLFFEGDKEKLDKIIFNLLSNAFKYTPDKGNIEVRISDPSDTRPMFSNQLKFGELSSHDFYEISVRDSGQGIDSEDLLQVFNRFGQGKSKIKTGTGIGLSLVKEYTLLHQGEVIAQSSPGKGTRINICLPRKQTAQRLLSETVQEVKKPALSNTVIEPKIVDANILKGAKIMVVEDNSDLRLYITEVLKPYYQIVTAPNGVEALKLLKSFPVNLIVSDVMMPEMDGIELCSILKSQLETSHIPVILLTALSSTENRVTGLQQGADAYISKPFEDVLLITMVNNLLTQRKLLKENYKDSLIEGQATDIGSLDNYFLDNITKKIHANLDDELFSVEDLANELGIHRSQLHRKLKQLTNFSTSEYIRVIRLKNASELLKSDEYTIDEIASMSGFNSHSYFTKCFKKFYGVSPKQYMNKYTLNNHSEKV